MRYRKKPVEVEAMQWLGSEQPDGTRDPVRFARRMEEAEAWLMAHGQQVKFRSDSILLRIGSDMTLVTHPGDWIVIGDENRAYVVDPDIFEAAYEPID